MTWTYEPETDIGRIRLLIPDRVEASAMFTDEELSAFYALEDSNVKLAVATALLAIATDEVLVQKRITLLDLSTDGPAEAKALQERARELRRQVEDGSETDGGDFAVVEMVTGVFTEREKLLAEANRRG